LTRPVYSVCVSRPHIEGSLVLTPCMRVTDGQTGIIPMAKTALAVSHGKTVMRTDLLAVHIVCAYIF